MICEYVASLEVIKIDKSQEARLLPLCMILVYWWRFYAPSYICYRWLVGWIEELRIITGVVIC